MLGSTVWRRGGRRAFALPATTPSPRRVNNSQCSSAAYNQTMKLFLENANDSRVVVAVVTQSVSQSVLQLRVLLPYTQRIS